MVQVKHTEVPLEVVCFVPLYDAVFNFADATQVAVNLHNAVWVLVVAVLIVIEYCFFGWLSELRHEPFNTVYIKKSLHAEEVDCDLDYISLAHLDDWLDQGALLYTLLFLITGLDLIRRFRVLSLVLMDPN